MKRNRILMFGWIGLLLAWLGYFTAGRALTGILAPQYGSLLLRMGGEKFNNPEVFIQGRLRETLWLVTLAAACGLAHLILEFLLCQRFIKARWHWVVQGVAGFLLLNFWVGAAANTAIFWMVLGAGCGPQNYVQFQFKRILFEENRSPLRAVLVGSSQTRAEIDENELNRCLGSKLWTTELHFPGSRAYDLLLVEHSFQRADPQLVICYLSEGYFYSGTHGETPPNFLTFQMLPDASRRGAFKYLSNDEITYGLLGDLLPVFRCREAFSRRILGAATADLQQMQYDQALESNLEERARISAQKFRIDEKSDFQKKAFEDFVTRCEQSGRKVILLEGGYHPALARLMDSQIRRDMLDFLSGLRLRHPDVVLISTAELPKQTAADYIDLNHVNEDMQHRFSDFLAGWLRSYLEHNKLAMRK